MIRWRGVHKLQEEMAELSVELAKLCARPDGSHWDEADGKPPLLERIENEMGDVLAALDYFMNRSTVFDQMRIERRRADKLLVFRKWKLLGLEDGGVSVATTYEMLRAAGVMAGSPADAVADTRALHDALTTESLDEVASVRVRKPYHLLYRSMALCGAGAVAQLDSRWETAGFTDISIDRYTQSEGYFCAACVEEVKKRRLDITFKSQRKPLCLGAECPRDGECPEHGKNRPGQCVTAVDSALPWEPEDGEGTSHWLGRGSRD